MRVVIADDAVLIREGVAHLLTESGVEVVDQVGDADALLTSVRDLKPDVALIDIRMPVNWNGKFFFYGVGGLAGSVPAQPDVRFGLICSHKTSPARSAFRWWVRSDGRRVACASSAAPMTSASTQPPPTDPINRPSAPTSILVPAGTGVEPRARATVASAPDPDLRTRSAAACQTFMLEKLNSRGLICPGSFRTQRQAYGVTTSVPLIPWAA